MASKDTRGAAQAKLPAAADRVVLVDESDREVGSCEKLAAHRDGGLLHRAFSIFLFDARGRVLLQQRAAAKYHFPLLWTNTCCGHPRPGEAVVEAARRRLREELGVDVPLRPVSAFLYTAEDPETGLTEREYDHVLVGALEGDPTPNADEVEAVSWREPAELRRDVAERPLRYTPWFELALSELERRGLLDVGPRGPGPAAR